MGSNYHLADERGRWARPDQLVWGDWGDQEDELTEAEKEALRSKFKSENPPFEIAKDVKKMLKHGASIREIVALNKGTKRWSHGTVSKISAALNTTTTDRGTETAQSVTISTLSIDF